MGDIKSIIKPGDTLAYSPSSFAGVWIALKTWTWLSHVELYVGGGLSIGARSEGVNYYPLRTAQLAYVLRPKGAFNLDNAIAFFDANLKGNDYAFLGLLDFYTIHGRAPKQEEFCSQTNTILYRAGGFMPFAPAYPADRIAPAQYLQSPSFDWVWQKSVDGKVQ